MNVASDLKTHKPTMNKWEKLKLLKIYAANLLGILQSFLSLFCMLHRSFFFGFCFAFLCCIESSERKKIKLIYMHFACSRSKLFTGNLCYAMLCDVWRLSADLRVIWSRQCHCMIFVASETYVYSIVIVFLVGFGAVMIFFFLSFPYHLILLSVVLSPREYLLLTFSTCFHIH